MSESLTVAVLGCGKMGESLITGWLDSNLLDRSKIRATVRTRRRAEIVGQALDLPIGFDNRQAVEGADVVIVATKPQVVTEVLKEVSDLLTAETLVISLAAGTTLAQLEGVLQSGVPVIRAMPNTPCLLKVGMAVLSAGSHTSQAHLDVAEGLFKALGRTMVLAEKHMDAVTALSASGPAFIYVVIESLAEGGVKVGLPRDVATELAAQMVYGASQMVLETGSHPALLKDMVTTPAGCTADGLLELEEGGLRVTLIKSIVQTTKRSSELAD